jgi:hypothetical protein
MCLAGMVDLCAWPLAIVHAAVTSAVGSTSKADLIVDDLLFGTAGAFVAANLSNAVMHDQNCPPPISPSLHPISAAQL